MGLTLNIVFENGKTSYFAGEKVLGKVKVTTDRSINCEGLYMAVEGSAQVVLKKSKVACSSKKAIMKEVYYKPIFNIWRDNISVRTLNPGEHSFNFKFRIASRAPASFTSKNGSVTHTCQASLKLHRSLSQGPDVSVPFFVHTKMDLNQEPLAKNIINEDVTKKISTLLGRVNLGFISLKVNVNRSGYIPGEDLIIDARCNNDSTRIMTDMRAEIMQETIFRVGDHSQFSQHVVASKNIEFGNEKLSAWRNENLRVPNLVPSGLNGCNIIDVQYRFKFMVLSQSGKSELETSVPLIIGSVPLRQDYPSPSEASIYPRMAELYSPRQTLPSAPPHVTLPAAPPHQTLPAAPPHQTLPAAPPHQTLPSAPPRHLIEPNAIPDAPPPSYEETYPNFSGHFPPKGRKGKK